MWLLKKYMMENRSMLRFSALFIFVVMLLITMINGLAFMNCDESEKEIAEEIVFMSIGFFVTGCAMGSSSFNDLNDKNKLTAMLMTPVSALEQFIVRWIVYVPVYVVWTLLCVMFADIFKYVSYNFIFNGKVTMLPWADFFSGDFMYLYFRLLLFIVLQSFFMLGAVVWRKNKFFKTFYMMVALFILYSIPVAMVFDSYETGCGSFFSIVGNDLGYIPLQLLLWITVIVNYTVTVMRLKESEIIHRL